MTEGATKVAFAGGRDVTAQLAVKRAMDIVGSALLLVLLAPLLAVVAILVKTTSPGPLLYGCDWVGQNGRRFRGYKFRTMVPDADAQEASLAAGNLMNGPAFKLEHDPRITPLGRVLRKYSLDELPQLWSVLKGDLSLVGPRAPREHEYAKFTPFQRQKLAAKQGLTCLWQVEGRHRITDYDEWVKLDLQYIRDWSLWLDIKILFRTIGVVVRGTGA
ncbi:sugar transferase [Caulobacter sp. SLTY]|uniref:sugar transferase n=1 Tax=Caulobacter sp. SLTY TaxID=2683262 RepID=UPI00196B3869|nr:sugar transferase [Caulobacter sp. SLTY]